MTKIILLLIILLNCTVCRILAQDGNLDSTFSDDGKITTDFGSNDYGQGVAIQTDGKIVVSGNNWSNLLLVRYNTDGTLDTSFSNDGKAIISSSYSSSGHVAIQSDGRIVVCGGAYFEYALARYNANGIPDSSFNSDGIVYTQASYIDVAFKSLAIQSDGKIVTAGYAGQTIMGAYYLMALARYNTDGTLDDFKEFNVDTSLYDHDVYDLANSVTLQPDSKIIVAGTSQGNMVVIRFNDDFSLDNSFGENGLVAISVGTWSSARSVSIQQDQKIVVAGVSTEGLTLVRLNVDGALDNTFGFGGIANTLGAGSGATSVEVLENGKIQVAGYSDVDFALARYNSEGSLDSSFGINGIVTTDMGSYYDEANSMAIQDGGNIVIAGSSGGGNNNDFAVAKYIASLNVGIIDLSSSTNSVLIYPNPVEQTATLEYSLKNPETISIRLLDVQGKVLKTFTENESQVGGEHQQEISFPDQLPSGFYFLTISSANGGSVSVKIVK